MTRPLGKTCPHASLIQLVKSNSFSHPIGGHNSKHCRGHAIQKYSTLYWNFETYIPRNETAGPRSQFLHSCIWFIYSHHRSSAVQSWKYINRTQILECANWETKHYNSVLEITRLRSFISGNTEIGTRHLYWILIGPAFAVHQDLEMQALMTGFPQVVCNFLQMFVISKVKY